MNPVAAGLTSGIALSLAGLAVIWPALGRGLLPLMARVTGVFLGKLAALTVLILVVHAKAGKDFAQPYAVSLAFSVVALLLAQAALLAWRLRRLEGPERTTVDAEPPRVNEGAGPSA